MVTSPPRVGSPAAGRDVSRAPFLAAAATGAGVALGALDLLGQHVLPYPWANLANSTAVWAVVAWLVAGGLARGRGTAVGAVLGVVVLVAAVEAYYAAAALLQHDDIALLTARTTLLWCLYGVVAGVLFGAGGAAVGASRRGAAVLGAALPAAVLLGEATMLVHRVTQGLPGNNLAVAALEAGSGIGITVAARRGRGDLALTLIVAALLAVSAFGAFAVIGIGFAAA